MDKKTVFNNNNSLPDVDVPPSYNEVINPPNENISYRGGESSSTNNNNQQQQQPSAPPSSVILVQDNVDNEYTRMNNNNSQQYYYQSIPIPSPQAQAEAPTLERIRYIIKRRDQDEGHFPINASLFLLGCLFPPLWYIGCCWKSRNKYEVFWRKLNICMSILCTLVCILFLFLLAIAILFDNGDDQRRPPITDPDWQIPEFFTYF